MENASKALIIAGAILLAILIISLGILIYNQASGVVTNNSMDEVSIQTFNNKFLQYAGEQKGSAVRSLLSQVNSSKASDPEHVVTIDPSTIDTADIQSGGTYSVTVNIDSTTGYVNQVVIDGPGANPSAGTP